MSKETAIQLFEQKEVRSLWSYEDEKWYFSIIEFRLKGKDKTTTSMGGVL